MDIPMSYCFFTMSDYVIIWISSSRKIDLNDGNPFYKRGEYGTETGVANLVNRSALHLYRRRPLLIANSSVLSHNALF